MSVERLDSIEANQREMHEELSQHSSQIAALGAYFFGTQGKG